MHSEGDIRRAISPLIERYGKLTISEVKDKLNDVLEFDNEDLEPSPTRPGETKIIQRIGNIVSHQAESERLYPEGFIVNKNEVPAVFIAVHGFGNNLVPITKKEILIRNKKAQNTNQKADWGKINEERSDIGTKGEEFIFQYERDNVAMLDPAAVSRVIWVSRDLGDSYGYDILSLDSQGNVKFIEVKTTTGKDTQPFYLTKNEKEFLENNDNVVIYRVYDFDRERGYGKILEITSTQLLSNYLLDPVTFKVTHK